MKKMSLMNNTQFKVVFTIFSSDILSYTGERWQQVIILVMVILFLISLLVSSQHSGGGRSCLSITIGTVYCAWCTGAEERPSQG